MPSLLILEHDAGLAGSAAELAARAGYEVHIAHTVAHARERMTGPRIDLLLLDLALPDGSGMELIEHADLPRHGRVVLVAGNAAIEGAARAVSSTAVEFFAKPLEPARFARLLHDVARTARPATAQADAPARLLGDSPAIADLRQLLRHVAEIDATLLVSGEPGTGRGTVARAWHAMGRRAGPFVALDCSAVDPDRLVARIYGPVCARGDEVARGEAGLWQHAAGGTLLLARFEQVPAGVQDAVLRRVRATAASATQAMRPARLALCLPPPASAPGGEAALVERLRLLPGLPVTVPPLRERGRDVALLAATFIERLNAAYGMRKRLDPRCVRDLTRHAWPGNVRELRGAVQRAFLLERSEDVMVRPAGGVHTVWARSPTALTFAVGTPLAEMERLMLLTTLAWCDNDKTATARALGISVRTVHNQLARIHGRKHDVSSGTRDDAAA